jgi:hypothetical protein
MSGDLDDLRKELSLGIRTVVRMLERASTVADRRWLLAVLRIMDQIATSIDNQVLLARAEAVDELRKSLAKGKADLEEVHSRAKQLASRLGLAAKAVEALGNLAKQVAK